MTNARKAEQGPCRATFPHGGGERRIVVIGAGAAGMMAAGRAAERGAEVLLCEKTEHPGKKLLVSGKTRCNLTNARELDGFMGMYGPGGPFLHAAFRRFFREDLLAFLERYGVETKTERGGRIFPVSDRAEDVLAAFRAYLKEQGVRLRTGSPVTAIRTEAARVTGVQTSRDLYPAAAVILATGGATWPATGSTGDGYRLAAALGHRIVPLRPALVPLAVREISLARGLQGVSLRNVRLTAFRGPADGIDPGRIPENECGRGIGGRKPRPPVIESRMGEMMFTHFGIGGPIVLLMSLAVVDALVAGPVGVSIDLKPALTPARLRERLQRDFDRHGRRQFRRHLEGLLPAKMVAPFLALTDIPADKPGHQIAASERDRLAGLLKSLRFNVKAPLPMASAIVTAGGIALEEVDPRTMASRKVSGLFFCGEVLDIDADTGGYNLQAAFSTGYLAGEGAADVVLSPDVSAREGHGRERTGIEVVGQEPETFLRREGAS
ncbi:MAG TPA: NAD(P)/FAD-dependent oxidoreductase [Syntrophales bacterium]|nr:NAD(P)/FAD-dependent oxidoreductase [Syntrophales bacterium]